jgi:hypothetical protein
MAVACGTAVSSGTKGYILSYRRCERLESYVVVKLASKFAWELRVSVRFFVILFSLLLVSFVYCIYFILLFFMINGYFLCRIVSFPLRNVIIRLNNKY